MGVLIENADKLIIDAQGAYQILLPPFLFASFLFLLKFLGRAVQKKALAYNLAVLLHQLGIAHHMQLFAVRMFDTVFITRAVADLFQLTDGRHELGFVLIHDRAGDHLEAFGLHLVKGSEIQQIQGCPVDADDVRPIQRMAQDAAIHGGEHGFQRGLCGCAAPWGHDFQGIGTQPAGGHGGRFRGLRGGPQRQPPCRGHRCRSGGNHPAGGTDSRPLHHGSPRRQLVLHERLHLPAHRVDCAYHRQISGTPPCRHGHAGGRTGGRGHVPHAAGAAAALGADRVRRLSAADSGHSCARTRHSARPQKLHHRSFALP